MTQYCQGYLMSGPREGERCPHPVRWIIHCFPLGYPREVCGRHVEYWAVIGGAHPVTQSYEDWRLDWDSTHGPTTPQQDFEQWHQVTHDTRGRVGRRVKRKLFADARRALDTGGQAGG